MKRILFLISVLLFTGSQILASEYKGGQTVHVAKGDTVTTDLMASGRTVQINGVLLGDVFAAGEHVNIEGGVGDDVFAAGKNVNITSRVGGMVFGGGETVLIDSEVGDDVFIGGGTVRITENAHIHGNVFIGTGNLLFEGGRIDGNLRGGSGRAYVNGAVAGDVEWGTEYIDIGDEFQVAGEFELKLPESMKGKEIANLPENTVIKYSERNYAGALFKFFIGLLMALVLGLCYVQFFKEFSRDQLEYTRQNVLPGLGVGFLALIATPILIIILGVMVLTIPIALFLLAFYLMLLYFSGIITGIFLGAEILSRTGKAQATLIPMLILGVVVLALLKAIPLLGFLVSLVAVSFGMGSFILFAWHTYNNNKPGVSA
ncbi:MAG: hypothetical protein DWQ10_11350 [Calditrichaeota bacterium]|nr:MAG: hypothetical protein DWQ10_11350 [Calditrichota bacterium]